jgi:hypothetical protein
MTEFPHEYRGRHRPVGGGGGHPRRRGRGPDRAAARRVTDIASPLPGLPFGPFDPAGHRTFELGLRAFVTEQTRFQLGYVEQLYTFGDEGRDAPRAEMGAGAARVVSVGYLGLTPKAVETQAPDTAWAPWSAFFPWEDWRHGRPALLDEAIAPALRRWAGDDAAKWSRARLAFALDGAPWNEERVLERYELLYEAGLAPEAARDRARAEGHDPAEPAALSAALGEPMISDHRRILATGLSRMRGKIKYRPVVFELMPAEFTLSALQRTVEAIAGVPLHKQNFRRVVEREDLGRGPGPPGRRHRRPPGRAVPLPPRDAGRAPATGLSLPLLRD